MSMDEVDLPGNDEWGTVGGPTYLTDIVRVRSGAEERTGRINQPRHRYRPARQVQTRVVMASLLTFVHARKGSLIAFRVKDNNDFTTGSDHVGTGAFGDVEFAVAVSGTQVYQLVKKYTSGPSTTSRKIKKPVGSTVKIGIDGVEKSSPADFTVSESTGDVTFVAVLSGGESLTWGGEFRVPVRFEKSVEELFAIINQGPDFLGVRDLGMVELLDDDPVPYPFNPLGDKNHGTATAVTLALTDGIFHVFENTLSCDVTLPPSTDLPGGGPYFSLKADGSASVVVKADGGSPTIDTLTTGQHSMLWLGKDVAAVRKWHSLK